MNDMSHDPQLEVLVADYLDGRMDDADWEVLRRRLNEDRAARDYFRAMTDLHAVLLGDALNTGAVLAEKDPALRHARLKSTAEVFRSRRRMLAGLAAAACVALGVAWWWPSMGEEVTLARVVGGVFETEALVAGERVGRGEIRLSGGWVELRFPRCEATVLVEAPASFRVVDAETLWLGTGRLTADVQNGAEHGLRVLTPDSDVLDLGTRFAVDIVEGRGSEVHVFEGEVTAAVRKDGSAGEARSLAEGEALRVGKTGTVTEREMRRAAFVHGGELGLLEQGWAAQKRKDFESFAARMRADPDLLAYLDFSPDDDAQMGQNHGARRVQGRFPGTSAVEFLDEGDHVRFDLDAVANELTLMAWVRLDHNATGVNSIYHTDNWRTPGQVHWMVAEGKQMRLAVFGQVIPDVRGWPESKRTIIQDLGRWVHLASVYDSGSGRVRFFIDGQFDSEVRLDKSPPAVLGPAQIGNWSTHNTRFGDRRLSGRIDELVILTRPLSDAEIVAWHEAGSPY